MTSVAGRPAMRGTAFVDKENVLTARSRPDTVKRSVKVSHGTLAASAPGKSGLAGGRVPLKSNLPSGNTASSRTLEKSDAKAAGSASTKDSKQRGPPPAAEKGKNVLLAPKASNGSKLRSPPGDANVGRPLVKDVTNRTPATTRKGFKPLKDAPAPPRSNVTFSAKDFCSPDLSKMPAHPVARDSNPLQDRRVDSGLKSKRRLSREAAPAEPEVVVRDEACGVVEEDDVEIEYAPPKREYDELQDLLPIPELDLDAIKASLLEVPIVVSKEILEQYSKNDPFALPEDKEAESWDLMLKNTKAVDDFFFDPEFCALPPMEASPIIVDDIFRFD